MTREEAKALAGSLVDGGAKAGRAVLEFIEGEIDRGMGNSNLGLAWHVYCEKKGNCDHADFDRPLCEALEKVVAAFRAKGSEPIGFAYGGCGTCEEFAICLNNEFVCDVLGECHN